MVSILLGGGVLENIWDHAPGCGNHSVVNTGSVHTGLWNGSSRMKGNFHVRFQGEGVAATSPPYPTRPPQRHRPKLLPNHYRLSGERTRPRVPGSAPPLNPSPDVSDESGADDTQGRVCSLKDIPGLRFFSN
jgi:hypothetical protein